MSKGPWKKPTKHNPHCVVCGEPMHRSNYRNQTCGGPECRAIILLHPEMIENHAPVVKGVSRKRKRRTSVVRMLADLQVGLSDSAAEALVLGDLELARDNYWASDDWGTMEDERGAGIPESPEIWSWMSSRTALLKVIAKNEGEASLVVHKRPRERTSDAVKRSLGLTYPDMCDVFYAWRCPCPTDTRHYYDSIDDLPTEVGYHGACPRCGAAPLEVKNVAE